MNKEQIYDREIAPLMAQILSICKTNKIAMLADFAIGHDNDEGLRCTSAILTSDLNPPENMVLALELLRPKPVFNLLITEILSPPKATDQTKDQS